MSNKAEFVTYVNEEAGVVVAKHPCAGEEFFNDFTKTFRKIMQKCGVNNNNPIVIGITAESTAWFDKNIKRMNNLTGKAKCNFEAGDTFDVDFGKKLAKKRLAAKLDWYRLDLYDTLSGIAYNLFELFEKAIEDVDTKRVYSIKSIEDMIDEELS